MTRPTVSSDRELILYMAQHYDGRSYVGITGETLDKRKAGHLHQAERGSDYTFHQAIREHGASAFRWRELARGRETVVRTMEQVMIYEWELTDPEKGFNTKGGTGDGDHTGGQVRYQLRKNRWKEYAPPWLDLPRLRLPEVGIDTKVEVLHGMNDLDAVVRWFENLPFSVGSDRAGDLRGFAERLVRIADAADGD